MDKDGGPAFPSAFPELTGMSLHDYFAAAALNGLLTNPSMISPGQLKAERHHGNLVDLANKIADAMLEARPP